jgi:hypothetical protein
MPLLETITYRLKRGDRQQEFKIKKKDYGEMALYDIFYENTFLFTVSQEGRILLSNWECARNEPISLDEETLGKINRFILTHPALP